MIMNFKTMQISNIYEYQPTDKLDTSNPPIGENNYLKCPDCGAKLSYKNGELKFIKHAE